MDDWYDDECRLITEEKNKLYLRMHNEKFTRSALEDYRQARKKEKKVHRRKKREHINGKLEELEHQRNKNEMRLFYGEINKSRKDFKPRISMCRNEDGDIIGDEDGILNRWQRFYKNLLTNEEILEHDLTSYNYDNFSNNDVREEQPP